MPLKIKKSVVVNRKFLTKLANSIYNPKNRSFLRLCAGQLQNGPDPEDKSRPMHCGLGELYFAMTGMQPNVTHVGESDVVDLAVKLSPLHAKCVAEVLREKANVGIKKLKLPKDLEKALLTAVYDNIVEDDSESDAFRLVLNRIPKINDDVCEEESSLATYRKRSQAVAEKLREAAKLLP